MICRHCYDINSFGTDCDMDGNAHVAHIEIDNALFPPDLQNTDEARILIWELHNALFKIENSMTLKFEASCSTDFHTKLESIMTFLGNIRSGCGCTWKATDHKKWTCKSTCKQGKVYEKSEWETVLKTAKDLNSKPLCHWNSGVRCVAGKCGCPANNFYENERCHVELGFPCLEIKSNNNMIHALSDKCRAGLTCMDVCRLDIDVGDSNLVGLEYVAKVKEALIKAVSSANLDSIQTLVPGAHCHHEDDDLLRKTLKEIDPLLESAKTTGSSEEELQKVRQLEKMNMNIEVLKEDDHKYCKPPSSCHPDRRACSGLIPGDDDDDTNNNNYKPKPKPNSSAVNLLVKGLLVIPLLVAIAGTIICV